MEATAKLYSLNLHNTRTYLFALFFVAGNIIVPQLCHLIPNGGLMFLPIYFFTLVGAYKYGLPEADVRRAGNRPSERRWTVSLRQ